MKFARLSALPLILLMFGTVVIPMVESARLTVSPSGFAAAEQTSTIQVYKSFFTRDRGGVIGWCLILSIISVIVLTVVFLPPIATAAAIGAKRLLIAIEFALILPFFFSPAVRLVSLKGLLLPHGWIDRFFSFLGLGHGSSASILFTDVAVCLGLAMSFGGFFLLPVVQHLRRAPKSFRHATMDLGMGTWGAVLFILRYSASPAALGTALFICVSWFSSLEYQILGKRRSILNLMDDLSGVKKMTECYAYGTLTWCLTLVFLIIVLLALRPERLLDMHAGEEKNV